MDNNEKGLIEFIEICQKVADAIRAVLEMDVTIMDHRMYRIAGTGVYRDRLHQQIEPKTVFDYCLKTGQQYVIDQPKHNTVCCDCPRLNNCTEKAEICVPILYGKESAGVIGIIAFTEEQKRKLLTNQGIYINYLQKMASLLEAKFTESKMTDENELLSRRLMTIVNTIDEGLLLLDDKDQVLYQNNALIKLLQELGIKDTKRCLIKLIEQLKLKKPHESGTDEVGPMEIVFEYEGQHLTLLASFTLLPSKDGKKEYIVTLQSMRKLQKRMIQAAEKNQLRLKFQDIIGVSSVFTEIKKFAEKAARSDSSVLIYGESGTGKELFARAIHNQSPRQEQAFVPINCGAIPNELLESELFGYEKGAFTGAYNTKYGKFEVADNGTVFLDEISEMPFQLQVNLLRVLQEKEICRVGSNTIKKVNLRIIAATNTDLLTRIKNGLFREDLYYRLNIIPIHIPPLRERREDIPFIASYFLDYYAQKMNRKITGFSAAANRLFQEYHWPGNVRELQNVIEYAVNFEQSALISSACIEKRLKLSSSFKSSEHTADANELEQTLEACVRKAEKQLLAGKIKEHSADIEIIENMCRELAISRATLYRKLKETNLSIKSETVSKMR